MPPPPIAFRFSFWMLLGLLALVLLVVFLMLWVAGREPAGREAQPEIGPQSFAAPDPGPFRVPPGGHPGIGAA